MDGPDGLGSPPDQQYGRTKYIPQCAVFAGEKVYTGTDRYRRDYR